MRPALCGVQLACRLKLAQSPQNGLASSRRRWSYTLPPIPVYQPRYDRKRAFWALPAALAGAIGLFSLQVVYAEERTTDPLPASRALVVAVIGCDGSGKTTQAKKLASEFKMQMLSVEGDEAAVRDRLGKLAARGRPRVLIDGFPRNQADADWFQSKIAHLAFLVFMDTPAEDIAKRTRRDGKEVKSAYDAFHRDGASLIKSFRDRGHILEIAGEMDINEVWDMVEHKVDQCLQLDDRGEL